MGIGNNLKKIVREKGIKGIETDIEDESSQSASRRNPELAEDSTDSARSAMYEHSSEGSPKDS